MDKSDIFTAELILIFSLVIDISRYFHCRVWITSDVSIHLTSLNVPHFRNSNAYNTVCIRAYAEQTVTERTDVYRSTRFFAPKMFCTVFHPKLYASNALLYRP